MIHNINNVYIIMQEGIESVYKVLYRLNKLIFNPITITPEFFFNPPKKFKFMVGF